MTTDSGHDQLQTIGIFRGSDLRQVPSRPIATASWARAAGCAFAGVSSACTAALAVVMLAGGAVTGDTIGAGIGAAEGAVALLLGRWAQRTWRQQRKANG